MHGVLKMAEPITTIGVTAIGAYLGKDGVEKLLGPTAEYLGEGIKEFTKKRAETIVKIFQKAESKLGNKLDAPGEVPPKILKKVLDEGSFATSELEIEYLGGILASSRTDSGRDDRGARIAKLVDSLSTYQLRTHYLIYSTVRNLFSDKGFLMNMEGRPKMKIFIPLSEYVNAMDFSDTEINQLGSLLRHTFFGMAADNLIEDDWRYGDQDSLKKAFSRASEPGIICQPSALGAELFLWAFGYADKSLEYIFDAEFTGLIEGIPYGVNGALATEMPL